MATKYEEWSNDVNLAKSAGESEIVEVVASLRSGFRNVEKRSGTLLIAAAYATKAALDAETHTRKDLADAWSRNASTITLYFRLGIAALDLGIMPRVTGNAGPKFGDDQSLWTLLAGKGGATNSKVGNYLEGRDPYRKETVDGKEKAVAVVPTVEGLQDLLSDYFKPDGSTYKPAESKVHEAKREAAVLGIEYVEEHESGDAPETVEGTRTNKATFTAAVTTITTKVDDLTSEEWADVQDLLGKMSKALKDRAAFEKKQTAKAV